MTRHSSPAPSERVGIKARLREELRKYLVVSAYLYVCFGAVQLYKAALLDEVGIRYLPLGFALGKALILGKFVLIGDVVSGRSRSTSRTLLRRIAHRTVLLLTLLVVLTIVEEVLVGAIHGRGVAQTLAEHGHLSLPEIGATVLLVLLMLIPLVTLSELSRALGAGVLAATLFGPANAVGVSVSSETADTDRDDPHDC